MHGTTVLTHTNTSIFITINKRFDFSPVTTPNCNARTLRHIIFADIDVGVALLEDRSTNYTFTPIDLDIDQSIINGIIIDLNCDWLDAGSSVPNTTFTIFPSNNDDGSGSNITVETSPPNLITEDLIMIMEMMVGMVI